MQKSVAERPQAPREEFFITTLHAHFNQYPEALASINKALELSPNKQQFLNLKTSILLQFNKYTEAQTNAKKSYELETSDKQSAELYASTLIYNKQTAEAQKILQKSFGTTTVPVTEIINAYAQINDYATLVTLWESRVASKPQDVQSNLSLAYAYYKNGQIQKAVSILQNLENSNASLKGKLTQYIADIKAGRDPAATPGK
jgi:predicted Zn-dependent protease